MKNQTLQRISSIFIICSFLIIIQSTHSEVSYAEKLENDERASQTTTMETYNKNSNPCNPGTGWKWTHGPTIPSIADQLEKDLQLMNINASVFARRFGEEDSCGNFRLYAIDFNLTINKSQNNIPLSRTDYVTEISRILPDYGKPNLGNVKLTFAESGEVIHLKPETKFLGENENKNEDLFQEFTFELPYQSFFSLFSINFRNLDVIKKKVYVIVYDPILSNGEYLSDYLNWWDHNELTQDTIDFFYETSGHSLIYEVADFTLVSHEWPKKKDGFQYTETEYLSAYQGETPYHSPDEVDYNLIVNSPLFNICEKANQGEIDEVWIYNGPGFGFSESTLVGPNAYWYNSPQVPGTNTCERLIPIMGPSPERHLDCAIHNFGHRMESAMLKVYGSWEQNSISHNWEKFALVDHLSPDYFYSGCGNVHFPPNGTSDYDYSNPATVFSTCDDFANYPSLGKPSLTKTPITCDFWDCDHLGYLRYWFEHIPSYMGCASDNKANNWWKYFSTPELPLNPSLPCE